MHDQREPVEHYPICNKKKIQTKWNKMRRVKQQIQYGENDEFPRCWMTHCADEESTIEEEQDQAKIIVDETIDEGGI